MAFVRYKRLPTRLCGGGNRTTTCGDRLSECGEKKVNGISFRRFAGAVHGAASVEELPPARRVTAWQEPRPPGRVRLRQEARQ
jgi:hypothetical protein